MLKIQMQRTGRRNDPAFRIVVGEHTIGPKSGKFKEKLGSHHPKTKQTTINSERIKYWLSVGAQATGRVHNLLITEGVIEGKKVNVLPKHTPIKSEQPAEEPAPAAAASTETPEAEAETADAATDNADESTAAQEPDTQAASAEKEEAQEPAAETETPTAQDAPASEETEEKKQA